MAKGNFNGVMSGKLGNTIFYRNRNSNNKEKQGSRIYVPSPSNPQTQAQAARRMLLAPIVAFYRANRDLLDHSFIAAGSAGANYQRFLKLALADPDGVPYVTKNDKRAVPGRYVIAEGGLAPVTIDSVEAAGVLTELQLGPGNFAINATTTFGQISAAIINNNAGFVDGDELLFVGCEYNADQQVFNYLKQYVVLDSNNPDLLQSFTVLGTTYYMYNHVVLMNSGGTLAFFMPTSLVYTHNHVAAAVCHSRKREDGKYEYATTMLSVRASALADYFSNGAYTAARRSYMPSQSNTASDKLLQQAGNAAAFFETLVAIPARQVVDEAAVLAASTNNGTEVLWDQTNPNILFARYTDGTLRVVTSGDRDYADRVGDNAIVASTNGLDGVKLTVAGEGTGVDQVQVTFGMLLGNYEAVIYNSSMGTL